MFVKPNDQLGSFGASLISSFDGEAATLHDGTRLNAGELVSQLFGRNAYLFQPVVGNHPDLSPLTQKLATIRLITTHLQGWPTRDKPTAESLIDSKQRAMAKGARQ